MSDENQTEQTAHMVEMTNRDLISVLVLGGLVGLLVWIIGLLLNRYVFDTFFCQQGAGTMCTNAPVFSEAIALVISGIGALFGLIRLRVYRPLLVVLASAISLWGVGQIGWGLSWYWGALVSILLYLLAFGTFAWVARVRMFWIALATTIVLVAIVRVILAV